MIQLPFKFPPQFIELTKNRGGQTWVDATRIVEMNQGKVNDKGKESEPKKENPPAKGTAGKETKAPAEPMMTIIDLKDPKGKLFVMEHPDEIIKKIKNSTSHFEFAFRMKDSKDS